MGLFGGYEKFGPGIDKNAPSKKGIFRYFEILFRKIGKLFRLNMLTFIASLPFMAIMFFIAPVYADSSVFEMLGATGETDIAMQSLTLRTIFAVTAFAILGSGPASASYAYIARCFTREEHSWLWSDFKDKFKENFKQGMIVAIFNIILTVLLMTAIYFYSAQYSQTSSTIFLAFLCVSFIILLMFLSINLHIYQMMVTFSLSTVQLFKNSLLFSLANFPMNILLVLLALVVNAVIFSVLTAPFAVILSFLITTSLVRFPMEYSSARAIEKKLISRIAKNETSEDKGEE